MIGIGTQTYDPVGARIFTNTDRIEDLKNRQGERRLSRVATLEGGVTIIDFGFTDGDRTVKLCELEASVEAVDFVKYIIENYTLIVVTTDDGAYKVAPSAYWVDKGKLSLTMLISEKLSD